MGSKLFYTSPSNISPRKPPAMEGLNGVAAGVVEAMPIESQTDSNIMEPQLKALLNEEQIPQEVVKFLENNMVHTRRQFAFHAGSKEEVKSMIYDHIPDLPSWVNGRMVYIWQLVNRMVESEEVAVRPPPQVPLPQTNEEDISMSLPDVQGWQLTFETRYGFRLSSRCTASPKLLATLSKFITTKKSHVFISAASARSMDEAAAVPRIKRVRIAEGLLFERTEEASDWKSLHSNYQLIEQLELLLIGGYALVGNYKREDDDVLFAPLQACRGYIEYVKNKAIPHDAHHPPLSMIVKADTQTRCLWTESMRQGMTLGQAMEASRMHMEAFWLFACSSDAARIAARVQGRPARTTTMRRPQVNKGKGKGKSKNKGKSKGKSKSQEPQQQQHTEPRTNGKRLNYVEKGSNGTQICRLYNVGKCTAPTCPKGFLHICNYRTAGGHACGANHTRKSSH